MDVRTRNHVVVTGREDGPTLMLAHGFGCDQNMWRLVTPALARRFRVVLFDYVGAGRSDLSAWHPARYSTLDGYAQDVLDICGQLDLRQVVFVGHSVSAMTGVLAANREPDRFARLVLVTPSPRYVDDVDYRGGFSEADIQELLESLDSNYLGWSAVMAPVIMGNPDRTGADGGRRRGRGTGRTAGRLRYRTRRRRGPAGAERARGCRRLSTLAIDSDTVSTEAGTATVLRLRGAVDLHAARNRALAAAGIVLTAVPAHLVRRLRVVGLATVFPMHTSVTTATAAWQLGPV